MNITSYSNTMVSAMSAIRVSEAQVGKAMQDIGSGNLDAIPEAMTSLAVAKLAHSVAIKVIQESEEMNREMLNLLA